MTEPGGSYHVHRYEDAAEQERGLDGWSQTYCQLEPGRFDGSLETLALDGVTIQRETINLAVHQRTAPPPGRTVFVQCDPGTARWRMNAAAVDPGALMILKDSDEQTVSFPDSSDVLIVSVERNVLGESADRRPAALMAPRSDAFSFCASWLMSLLAHFAAAEGAGNTELAMILPGLIVDRLQYVGATLTGGGRVTAVDRSRSAALVRRAIALIEDRPSEIRSVADLARDLGVAPEGLREAFVETTGVGPGHWLRSRRLDGARRDLIRARDTGDSVTEVATRWGFWHFGRFAAAYSGQFGETPSRTVRGERPAGAGRQELTAVSPRSEPGPDPA